MIETLKRVYPLRMAPVSADTDRAVEILSEELPFEVYEYPSGAELNGWVIPQSWQPVVAEIRKKGELVYNGMAHPLGVAGYSSSFSGRVSLSELKRHLHYSEDHPDAIVFHGLYYYRFGAEEWGFCIPKTLFDTLEEGEYDVRLEARTAPGTLKTLVYHLPGESEETIVFNAHNCHPAQASDDLSGCVVGIETMKRLAGRRNHYSYRLIIAPELLGPIFYLDEIASSGPIPLKYCVLFKAVGTKEPLSLQKSFTGATELDEASLDYFRWHHPNAVIGDFRTVYGNDETAFEAPGYEIPTVSLTRYPFPEYHSSLDTPDVVLESKLQETVEAVLEIAQTLEHNVALRRHFDGLVSLSNKKFDLYIRGWDPAEPGGPTREDPRNWQHLMTCLPRYCNGQFTILQIANVHHLPFDQVFAYIDRYRVKGLVSFERAGPRREE